MGAGGREFESHRPDHFLVLVFKFQIVCRLNKEDKKIVRKLRLSKHPEGGWYRRTYSSQSSFIQNQSERLCGTSIYYYLAQKESSSLHCIDSDETWYFHFGSTVKLHLFYDDTYKLILLGNSWEAGEYSQFTVKKGFFFGAELVGDQGALLSCSVCPGFRLEGFKWGNKEKLLSAFPEQKEIILRLTKEI